MRRFREILQVFDTDVISTLNTPTGVGVCYELARKYGIHMGLDVVFGTDNIALYIQVFNPDDKPTFVFAVSVSF